MNDRKKHVLLIAKELFTEKGFYSTSIQEILDAAEISKGTFYNYFPSKNDCLMAILHDAFHSSYLRRRELAIGRDLKDPKLLSEQLHIRLTMNRQQNLLPLFETVVHSPDEELRNFVKQLHYKELAWTAKRITDIFGGHAKPYAIDCASLVFGFIQHSLHIGSSGPEKLDMQKLTDYAIDRIADMIPPMIEKKADFLPADVQEVILAADADLLPKYEIIELLETFLEQTADKESRGGLYGAFLIQEIAADEPRIYLLESVVRSFRQSFDGTPDQLQAAELAAVIWRFIDSI